MIRHFAQRHPLLWVYLFFLYFSGTIQGLILVSGMAGTVGLRQAILMSALWLIPVLIWPARARTISAIIGIVLWCGSLVGLGYWLFFGQDFSQSVIFIIFESNRQEGLEFLNSYLHLWHLGVLIVFTLIPYLMWRNISVLTLTPRYRGRALVLVSLLVSWPFTSSLLIKGFGVEASAYRQVVRMEPATPWNLLFGYVKYQQQLAAMETILARNSQIPPLQGLSETHQDAAKTLVLVIGESTNRQRMGLYGYGRDTTPNLDALGDEIVAFDNVVTARPYTIEALEQVLSFADSQTIEDFLNRPTLLNMMKQAGYDITWITNQQTQTKRNTMLTSFSQLADHQVYLNNNRAQNASQYDEEVLAPFKKALAGTARKKLIVVHLLGTHRKYDYRYPESFNVFSGRDGMPTWVSDENVAEYNAYDNAVRYNDFVVSSLIESLKASGGYSMLTYFSDHGEEVFDTPGAPFCGRNEYDPTPAMYTVPFLVWTSRQFAANNPVAQWQSYRHRPYSTADFIYSWADAAGLNFTGFEPERSIFNEDFVASPRWIGDPGRPDLLRAYSSVFPDKTSGQRVSLHEHRQPLPSL